MLTAYPTSTHLRNNSLYDPTLPRVAKYYKDRRKMLLKMTIIPATWRLATLGRQIGWIAASSLVHQVGYLVYGGSKPSALLQNNILLDEAPYYHSIDIRFIFTTFTHHQLSLTIEVPMMGRKVIISLANPKKPSLPLQMGHVDYYILPWKAMIDEIRVINLVFLILCL